MKRSFWIALALGLLVCLGIGYWWTARIDLPNPKPWWYGKNAVVRVQVWEPRKDMATVSMTMPKKAVDWAHALNVKSDVEIGSDRHFNINDVWGQVQRLPKGEKLHIHDREADVYVWIEEKGMPADSTWRPSTDSTRTADF
jgi:hypothetical protein